MLDYTDKLNSNVLNWLLDPDNPSVRYFALRTLLDRPEEDAEVQPALGFVLQKRCADGCWRLDETPKMRHNKLC